MGETRLHWRFIESAVDVTVNLLRRIYKHHPTFNNIGSTGIFSLGVDNQGLVFDQYFHEFEQYPLIFVAGQGGTLVNRAIGDIVGQQQQSQDVGLYKTMGSSDTLGFGQGIATGFEIDEDLEATTVTSRIKMINPGDDVTVTLCRGDGSGPVESVASGSFGPIMGSGYNSYMCELYPKVGLKRGEYCWLVFNTDDESHYRIGLSSESFKLGRYSGEINDPTKVQWEIEDGSVVCALQGVPHSVLGGALEFSIVFNCLAIEAEVSRRLAELTMLFLMLSKSGDFDRSVDGDIQVRLQDTSVLTQRGFALQGLSMGAEQVRERADERVFINTVVASLHGEWAAAFREDLLEGINLDESGVF